MLIITILVVLPYEEEIARPLCSQTTDKNQRFLGVKWIQNKRWIKNRSRVWFRLFANCNSCLINENKQKEKG